ncbi:MAG: pitrilysin family protein [Saprospiraceae bacterium]|nr:pitrilysin family protein [Saprospiraceae bacterium]
MLTFERRTLDNGMRVVVNEDPITPLVAVNVLYEVGSRDESPDRTGFAHLFEHLMFTGSRSAPDFDDPLQRAGGENNAYTTNDYTTFYEFLPADNLETALWLESDRMMALKIAKKSFLTQRKVVLEEFKETCLNEPYGDSWHHLSDMMYKVHPYRWPVIGFNMDHLKAATHEEVRAFYEQWYRPNNAVLAIAGRVKADEAFRLADKWFGGIPAGPTVQRHLPAEPAQTQVRRKVVTADVPLPLVFLAFRMPARLEPDFYACDLLADLLSEGPSSRLYRHLLKEQQLFSSIDAYVTGNHDPGLFIIEGRPSAGISPEKALEAIWSELDALCEQPVAERELEKVKHRYESTVVYAETSVLNNVQHLAYYESLCGAEWLNAEVNVYLNMQADTLHQAARKLFSRNLSGELIYLPKSV